MELIIKMDENGMWRGYAKLDGRVFPYICSHQFIEDTLMYHASLNTIKTGPFTDEEVADWHKYDKMLGDPSFMEGARSRVKVFLNEWQQNEW